MATKRRAAVGVAADEAVTPVVAEHTWVQFTDSEGKTHRVKSEDYLDGTPVSFEQTWVQFTDTEGKTHRVKSEDYKDGS